MPAIFARLRIDGHHRVGEKVGARPIAAPVIGTGAAQRDVDQAELGIGGGVPHPHVGARPVLPTIVQPGLMPHFARLRDGVEFPLPFAGAGIERTQVSEFALRHFGRERADDQRIAQDTGRIAVGRTVELRGTGIAEAAVDLAGRGIERHDRIAGRIEQARGDLIVARPPGDRAAQGGPRHLVSPDLPTGMRFQRDDGVAQRQVHRAPDDQRDGPRQYQAPTFRPQAISPRAFEPVHILARDVIERRVTLPGMVARVEGPVAVLRHDQAVARRRRSGDEERRGQECLLQARFLSTIQSQMTAATASLFASSIIA